MPARRSIAACRNSSPGYGANYTDEAAYKEKRKRNNEAVKKTREKSKQIAAQRKANVERLKKQNTQWKTNIKEAKESLETLKDLLLRQAKPEERDNIIKQIIEEPTDDEDDE
ncbi:CCAAT/enhancer-binding protein homolog 2-like [Stomoxys calcitrans]|uniref:CCAAT/enhancer-binding protein homolog 2-like n=1 Tax=Stomoxys calcitrans TaxID=35570 RepID=UPI0027E2B697|nr:CCAAT/enhancer-binding protein homolog 2-like [Stomoxys calcitrans]